MPHSSDINDLNALSALSDVDDALATDDQLLLLDLLYGELDADAERGARDVVESDATMRAELAAFEGLRGFMAQLPDEEPPAALSAKLLHAAAVGVPTAATTTTTSAAAASAAGAGGGFFAWLKKLFEPMMMHPSLAAAASLVLVAGIAGAMYLGGNSKMAEPQASSTVSEESTRFSGGATGAKEGERLGASTDPASAPVTRDLVVAPIEAKKLDKATLDEGGKGGRPSPKNQQQAQTVTRGDSFDDDTVARRRTKTKRRPTRESARPPTNSSTSEVQTLNPGFGGSGARSVPGGRAAPRPKMRPNKRPLTKPKPAAPRLADETAGANSPADSKDTAAPQKPTVTGTTIAAEPPQLPPLKTMDQEKPASKKQLPPAVRLHRQARTFAKKGDCRRVVAIAGQVRKLDSRYYDTRFLADKTLRRCLRSKSNVAR